MEMKYPVGYRYEEGGPGSGNFGHAGRPGLRGGSAPKGAGAWSPVIAQQEKRIYRIRTAEHGMAVAEDGTVILEKTGGKSSIRFTGDEMDKMRGAVFTHNHPAGCSFSGEGGDIQFALTTGLKEIRAVGRQGEHALGGEYLTTYRYVVSPDSGVRNMGWNQLNDKYILPLEAAQYKDFNRRMFDGTMTLEDANATHHHELWTTVDRALKADGMTLGYSRTEWDPYGEE